MSDLGLYTSMFVAIGCSAHAGFNLIGQLHSLIGVSGSKRKEAAQHPRRADSCPHPFTVACSPCYKINSKALQKHKDVLITHFNEL